ncbi:MAG TPA: metallophosphoesterase [Candidatus Binatus sp.]|nr:metallophosphoesterase [Candidatus Binatus sp.]
MASPGFAFANPQPSPDDYNEFNPQDVFADSKISTTPVTETIPAPWKTPPVMSLSDVLNASAIEGIQSAGKIVFHSTGDTGGVKEPSHQFAVADAMANDIGTETYAAGHPAFFYHLGDVVYYFGQERYYYDQFYDPYRDYAGPIFAIPGNHDGVLFKSEPVAFSLAPFYENFCSKAPTSDPSAKGFARTTMTQPGAYFTLNAPFLKIIGLYSNTSETTGVIGNATTGPAQLQFLQSQLAAAAAQRAQKGAAPFALVIAVHHPPFTISKSHFPSPDMLAQIDQACVSAKIWPDIVLSGHAHLYERYTRTMKADGRQIPYVVAGNGGYLNLSNPRQGKNGVNPQPGIPGNDGKGNQLTLNVYNNTVHGFLRLTVDAGSILCESLGVDETTLKTSTMDAFTVDLTKHVVATKGAAQPSRTRAGDVIRPKSAKAPKAKKKK